MDVRMDAWTSGLKFIESASRYANTQTKVGKQNKLDRIDETWVMPEAFKPMTAPLCPPVPPPLIAPSLDSRCPP